jgi:nucleoside-diphosphate-sugar epimerase
MRTWIILGCGFTGGHLARRLRTAGETVIATTRDAGRARLLARALDVETRVVDPFDPASLDAWIPSGAILVDSVPPDRERPTHANVVAAACARAGVKRAVYLSSTGVYGMGDGNWVDEETPASPTPAGRARVVAESAWRDVSAAAAFAQVTLRIAAIYGPAALPGAPGRGIHERLRAGTFSVAGAGDNWVSRIHVTDLCAAIQAAGTTDPLPRSIYCIADDEPTTARAHADAVAAALGLPPPPSIPAESVPAAEAYLRLSNRRVSNARMKRELGVALVYPTWREGLPSCI